MKKLEDISKNNVFEVPEGYFDRLPGVVQSRIASAKQEPQWSPYLRYGLKYALPILAITAAALFYRNSTGAPSTEQLLASIESADLVAYLGDSDMNSEDLLDNISLNLEEATEIQKNTMDEIILSDAALDSLTNEFESDYF